MRERRIILSRQALGKGLDALIPTHSKDYELETRGDTTETKEENILNLKINDIDPNPNQPRKDFDREKIEELATSIKNHGIIQPIIVREKNGRYMIIAGERRWRAAKIAGLIEIPAIVKDFEDKQMYMIALVENLQREDLDPIEEAMGIKKLMEEYDLTQDEIAREIGKSRSAIANIMRLLNLPKKIQELIRNGDITSGHGRALLALDDREQMEEVVGIVVEKNLNVRDTENLVKKLNSKEKTKTTNRRIEKPTYILDIESNLEECLGTKVNINPGKKKSTIQIEYYNNDDLERIMNTILNGF